ncbi:MAG TPA: hypothetical protein PK737_01820 [Bacilli bacterium]|nr:hypothetical protein [Bacilli bacterium]
MANSPRYLLPSSASRICFKQASLVSALQLTTLPSSKFNIIKIT